MHGQTQIKLTIDIQHTWHAITKVIPVKTGAKETISKSFREDVGGGGHNKKA
jgi:hypothetical protein